MILVACSKCPWQAAFSRADLITNYGAEYPLPDLLDNLALPGCSRTNNQWDRLRRLLCRAYRGARAVALQLMLPPSLR
jgi:hypothetical protein